MPEKNDYELPDGATALIALARVAHRGGDRTLERAAVGKLARDYGLTVSFPCCQSVDRDLATAGMTEGNANVR
jgi:hypothetical protein